MGEHDVSPAALRAWTMAAASGALHEAPHTLRATDLCNAVDRREALRLLTIDAAFFISEEKMLGSIEKGKYADVVVLNGDYMSVPENEIEKLEPVMTVAKRRVHGAVVVIAPANREADGEPAVAEDIQRRQLLGDQRDRM